MIFSFPIRDEIGWVWSYTFEAGVKNGNSRDL